MNKQRLVPLLTTLVLSLRAQFVQASVVRQQEVISENRTDDIIFHKRRRPHSSSTTVSAIEIDQETESSTSIQCKSIIAIGKTTLWTDDHEETRATDRTQHHTGEEFVCERDNGTDVPIQGTYDQIQELRDLLNNGTLISAESTVEVYQTSNIVITSLEQDTSLHHVVLPPGNIILQKPQQRRSQRLSYEGEKPVLVIRVIDKDGLVIGDDAKTISDKIFGTYGDTATMTSQYAACSFNKLQITWESTRAIQKVLSASGVLEVNIGISIKISDQGTIRSAVYEAAGKKLGFALPGVFQHVMFVLEGCYLDCG
jgi:hypothetical protein